MTARPDADPQLGRTLGGQYRIEALLGAGGMGRVYRGRQLSVNRSVAIKLIAGQAPYPPEWVRRFRREAEATASLSHPNSVRLFDFGVTESEELFMVMELLEGTDLARQLLAHGPLPLVTALSITRQVLLALCEAHELGITHRDIKPDNIFLASVRGADVVAKVMDFGIAGLAHAQRQSRLTGTGVIIGTPLYMSPEQAQSMPVDGKSDLYSLGVVLFEMLTGRPVFESNTAVTLLLAHVARPPMRLDEAGVQLREQSSLQALLDRLLAKEPALRPTAAEALEVVTSLSARLGIASATGSMRAVTLNTPPPLPAARALSLAGATGPTHAAIPLPLPAAGGLSAANAPRPTPAARAQELASADPHAQGASADFQAVRPSHLATSTALRPGAFLLGAALVLTAGGALALRWVPTLVESSQPLAAERSLSPATAPLAPQTRTVRIDSQPSGAQVLLDGEKLGSTPFELELSADTQISVARDGYARQLVKVPYDAQSPVTVKLVAQAAAPKDDKSAPLFFSFKQETQPRIEQRAEANPARERAPNVLRPRGSTATTPRRADEHTPGSARIEQEPSLYAALPSGINTDIPPGTEPPPSTANDSRQVDAREGPARENSMNAQDLRARDDSAHADVALRRDSVSARELAARDGDERSRRERELASEHSRAAEDDGAAARELALAREEVRARSSGGGRGEAPPSAAKTGRAPATHVEAIQEEELGEIALDDDERAHVARHYGLRAFGRAVARAVGRLLIPYPDRARRAALASMPLRYFSFREARAAYKNGEVDATGFQEAVWQLRERRRRKITVERDRYAHGQLDQRQYEAQIDKIWDEFWGHR